MGKVIENGFVYEFINDGGIMKTAVCPEFSLTIQGGTSVGIGATLPLLVEYRDWLGDPRADIQAPIKVAVTGPDGTHEVTLAPVDGRAEFEFVSDAAGNFTILAVATGVTCGSGRIEVTVA